ncbi:hypothetical protein F5Y18DRAFT_424577 [Xylariaceae sp. FL1019]|nr:hypothetical protein F5Y18DRAFT_424577 [Xylariaceae sp. FL1019]
MPMLARISSRRGLLQKCEIIGVSAWYADATTASDVARALVVPSGSQGLDIHSTLGFASSIIHEKDILSLPLFPTRFINTQDSGIHRKQLIERGKKVFRFAKGPAFYNRAQVIIDHGSQPWKRPEFQSTSDWNLAPSEDKQSQTQRPIRVNGIPSEIPYESLGQRARAPRCEFNKLSDHQYLICMSHMFGFVLKDCTYDLLDVSNMVDVCFIEKAIDRLVMRPESNKDTIKAIVQTCVDNDQTGHFTADSIRGKGEGQIFLLHGPATWYWKDPHCWYVVSRAFETNIEAL